MSATRSPISLKGIDPEKFVTHMRDHYVAQFKAFVDEQRRSCAQGASELKLEPNSTTELFQNLYCVDFIRRDGEDYQILELGPGDMPCFDAIFASLGAAALSIEPLRWNDVVVRHDLASTPIDEVARWFRRWFDPEDEWVDPNADLSGVIHSLLIKPGALSVDFGTAPVDAFWEMLGVLGRAGARNIQIGGSSVNTTMAH